MNRPLILRRILLAVLTLALIGSACGPAESDDDDDGATSPTPTNTAAPAPPVAGPLADLELSDGWTNPRFLPEGVNTTGWEDSSFISPDGQTLYFGYSRGNITMLVNSGMSVADGPNRPGHHFDGFDI